MLQFDGKNMSYSSISKNKSQEVEEDEEAEEGDLGEVVEVEEDDEKNWCCSISYYQRLISFFNGVYLVSGLVLSGLSIWTYVAHQPFLAIIPNATYKIVVYLTLATASFVCLTSLVGVFTAKNTWKSSTSIYLAFVIVTWMSEIVIGMLSYTYMDEVRSDLSRNLVNPMQRFYHGNDEKFTQHVDFIQTRLRCCGANSPQDWNSSQWRLKVWSKDIEAVPISCCKTPNSIQCGLRIHPSSISFTGCVHPISQHIQHRLSIFASVSLGFSVLQILGIPFILLFLCKLYQLDINRKERIRKKELETSRFTRNQPRFNLLNSCKDDDFQYKNGFHQENGATVKGKEEDFQYQNGFHQENGTTAMNTANPVTNGHKPHYPMSTRV